jgi:hypothetical protein
MYTLLFALLQSVSAASLSDVSMPDKIILQNETLQLNGLGLREKYWIDIYVAGLYLPKKMTDGTTVINANVTKRIQIEFVYSDVSKEKMVEVLEENIRNNNFSEETIASIRKCGSWMQDFTTGDMVVFDYIPTTQTTTIYINGESRGSISSENFMKAIFVMYVGKYPATESLKKGLLGG